MRNHRITDGQAAALLDGRAPEGRDDLQDVAALVGTLRLASFEAPPQPTAALAARLDLDRLEWVSAQGAGVPSGAVERSTVLTQRGPKGKIKTALGWFTGLGIAAQLALGAGAVSASAAGIGLAGALPPAAQEVFDTVVATVGGTSGGADGVPVEGTDDAGTGTGSDTPLDGVVDTPDTDSIPNGEVADGSDSPGNGNGNGNGSGSPEKAEKPGKPEEPGKSGNAGKPEHAADGKPVKDGSDTERGNGVPGRGDNSPDAGTSPDKEGATGSNARDGEGDPKSGSADAGEGRSKDKPAKETTD